MKGKKASSKNDFYLSVYNELKQSTNLTKIQKKLNISKQQLNYYLRKLLKNNLIIKKDIGWYEISKKTPKYDILLQPNSVRGHAYVWEIKLEKIPSNWFNRINLLKKREINYKLVGAKKTTPRIKVLGRKIWLCNDHLRIYDKKNASYYGTTAKESRFYAFNQIKLITNALNNKLGTSLKPSDIYFRKEHYALIKNELAIQENMKGNIWRINDSEGEWLLIDDSLGEGGELETVGKKAFKNNIPLQNWWNDNKKHNFEVTSSFILESFNKTLQNFELAQKEIFNLKQENHLIKNQLSLNPPELNLPSYIT